MATEIGNALAEVAIKALRDPAFTSGAGYCQQFVREVVQEVSREYDGYWRASAYETMLAFQGTPFDVAGGACPADMLVAGDLLYKGRLTSGPFGHVGICAHIPLNGVPVLCVVENSSYHVNPYHMGDVSGAKGYRTLSAFGPFEMVVRLR